MDKNWKISQLELLKKGESIFRSIPDGIGEILYCDSTEERAEPYTPKEKMTKRIYGILISVGGLSVVWTLLYSHYIWAAVLSIIILIIAWAVGNCIFSGQDYYVGTKGFAINTFSDTRENVYQSEQYLFKDMCGLFTGETIHMKNFSYEKTSYSFMVYMLTTDEKLNITPKMSLKVEDDYYDETPKDPMNPDGAPATYGFMKTVEKYWTILFVQNHKDDDTITFPCHPTSLILTHNSLIIGNVEYTKENTKNMYFSNGELIVEHINHSKKLLGLIEEGNISKIPLGGLANRNAFLTLLHMRGLIG